MSTKINKGFPGGANGEEPKNFAFYTSPSVLNLILLPT